MPRHDILDAGHKDDLCVGRDLDGAKQPCCNLCLEDLDRRASDSTASYDWMRSVNEGAELGSQ